MSTYTSGTITDLRSVEEEELDVASSYIENAIRILVFGESEMEVYLSEETARQLAETLILHADRLATHRGGEYKRADVEFHKATRRDRRKIHDA